ncbi:diacylglycerol/lipid kinase family protein [Gracilibacillus kekensis]|uniref:Lipid kinase, YegS/Rv2252/BmrU family n=1 Tax=Gracilibacillus kekensis TaxID=1027249 RepID=A0A1M7QW80_9BACI|nr:diacylglycerol kinase family protein [Gracilibacillus kekensis]SHN36217.1 lipid kinase, YegS/Rv2252/BmrU family [Gracilibacillus kekensis]
MKQRAMIIVNPSSGTEKSVQFKQNVYTILVEQGYIVKLKETSKEGDALNFATKASDDHFDLITIMGGDGTINEVINGIAEKEVRPSLHIIPLGTVNNFAKALELPLKPQQAIELIKNSKKKQVDLGKINDSYFMNLVNIGAIAEATYQVTAEQKSKLGSLAYLIEGLKKFSEKDLFSVTIATEETDVQLNVMLVLVALTDAFGGLKNAISEAEVDDGYLHVFAFKEITNLESIAMLKNLVNGQLKDQPQIEYWKTKNLNIESTPDKVANVDGDEGFSTPLHMSVLEKHLTIISQDN